MDLDWLETFLAVHRTGSFRRAATQRFVSQAAVSQQMARLEADLGCRLFDRTGRRASLNPVGARFVADAERMVALWRQSRAELGREAERERLVLAADWLTAETVTPWLCRQLLLNRPQADLVVRVTPTMTAATEDWDVALVSEPDALHGWRGDLLYVDAVLWVTPSEGGDLDQPPPDPERLLRDRRVLVPAEARYWDEVDARLKTAGYGTRTVPIGHPAVIKRLVAEGVGTSFLPELMVRREVMEGRLLSVFLPELGAVTAPTHFIRRDPLGGPRVRALADLAGELLRRRFPAR